MKTALITGITGQDGSYLAELLLAKGYVVVGTTRDTSAASKVLPHSLRDKVELAVWNMLDQQRLNNILSKYQPAELYNCAACSSGAGMFDDSVGIGEVNGLAVSRILESIRKIDASIRFCQASSREIFGEPLQSPQTERTSLCPRSPYGAAKLYADSMIKIYRQKYTLFACSAILYNHESPRRGLGFVTRKITYEAARIKRGLAETLILGNLDARRDWGFAGDYVRAMWQMLQLNEPDDFILATGETHSVREVCEIAFEYLGLDYRNFIVENCFDYRPSEINQLVGDATKARRLLNWSPQISFDVLIRMMVESDLHALDMNIIENKEDN